VSGNYEYLRMNFDWERSCLLLGWPCESYGTVTLAGLD
jgi:hypothetical protein